MLNSLSNYSKKQIISILALIILVIAIPLSVFLVSNAQILKGRAVSNPILDAFIIKDKNNNDLLCNSNTNLLTCTTSTQEITITVKNMDALIQK